MRFCMEHNFNCRKILLALLIYLCFMQMVIYISVFLNECVCIWTIYIHMCICVNFLFTSAVMRISECCTADLGASFSSNFSG